MVQNRKEVCMSTDEKRADLGSFSDRTGYNNKMIFFCLFGDDPLALASILHNKPLHSGVFTTYMDGGK